MTKSTQVFAVSVIIWKIADQEFFESYVFVSPHCEILQIVCSPEW